MGATLDGKVLTKISGESVFAYISGGNLQADISGSAVTVSGNAVTVSGNALFVYISGGGSSVSGSAVTVSGNVVSVSGQSVFVYISGGSISAVISGTVSVSISGDIVTSKISGETVVTSVSGNAVFVYISGGSVTTIQGIGGHSVSVSGSATIAISSVITTAGTYLEWIALHMTSGAVTSSEFYATIQQISSVAFTTRIASVNPAATTAFDIFYQPDNKLLLLSGAVVSVIYSNPDSRNYGCGIMYSD